MLVGFCTRESELAKSAFHFFLIYFLFFSLLLFLHAARTMEKFQGLEEKQEKIQVQWVVIDTLERE